MARALTKPGQAHVMLDLAGHGLPEVPVLGIHNQPWAQIGLSLHRHEGAMEISYLVKGELVFHAEGRDHALEGNDIFWTRADEPHSSGRNPFGKSLLYWLQIVLPARPRKFLALSADEAWPLVAALRSLPARRFRGDVRLKTVYEEAFELARRAPSPLDRLAIATRLVEWLRIVVECGTKGSSPARSGDIARAVELVAAREDGGYSIAELARAVHLSESRFKAKFREQLGMPPGEYLLRHRVARAEGLLASGRCSVTEAAHALGFSSSQYFATVFRRFRNMPPSHARGKAER